MVRVVYTGQRQRGVSYGSVSVLGATATLADAFNNAGISDDADIIGGGLDGAGVSYSEQALPAAGRRSLGAFAALAAAALGQQRLAAAVEARSEHPIARAIVAEAKRRFMPIERVLKFQSVAGHGVSAEVTGRRIAVGNLKYFDGYESPERTALEERMKRKVWPPGAGAPSSSARSSSVR